MIYNLLYPLGYASKYYKYYLIAIFSIAILSLLSRVSFAHDWYTGTGCCGNFHCHPIDSCSEITKDAQGNLHWHQYIFTPLQEKPSQDSNCHVCTYGIKPDDTFCIFTQQSS